MGISTNVYDLLLLLCMTQFGFWSKTDIFRVKSPLLGLQFINIWRRFLTMEPPYVLIFLWLFLLEILHIFHLHSPQVAYFSIQELWGFGYCNFILRIYTQNCISPFFYYLIPLIPISFYWKRVSFFLRAADLEDSRWRSSSSDTNQIKSVAVMIFFWNMNVGRLRLIQYSSNIYLKREQY